MSQRLGTILSQEELRRCHQERDTSGPPAGQGQPLMEPGLFEAWGHQRQGMEEGARLLALSAVEPLRGQGPGWASFLVDEGSGPRRRNYLWPSSPKMHQALNSAPPPRHPPATLSRTRARQTPAGREVLSSCLQTGNGAQRGEIMVRK